MKRRKKKLKPKRNSRRSPTPPPTKPLTLKQQQDIWYAKLKAEGFQDVETTVNGTQFLKTWEGASSASDKTQVDPEYASAQNAYYTKAEHWLVEGTFASKREKLMWQLHSEGKSIRAIAAATSTKRDFVHRILKRIRYEMRYWHIYDSL